MFVIIQAHEYQKYAFILDQMFRLRKKVFADTLGWNVPVIGPFERDSYDSLCPAYLVWCNETRTRLYGGMRLMPTTGPTLLYDVFRATFPQAANLIAPGIWEGTRMCIDEEAIRRFSRCRCRPRLLHAAARALRMRPRPRYPHDDLKL